VDALTAVHVGVPEQRGLPAAEGAVRHRHRDRHAHAGHPSLHLGNEPLVEEQDAENVQGQDRIIGALSWEASFMNVASAMTVANVLGAFPKGGDHNAV
jgi:hypothetical protein